MPVSRHPELPYYFKYITDYALIPYSTSANQELLNQINSPYVQKRWVDIPSYQRGISWDLSNIEEFLSSDSLLLGNIILGQFQVTSHISGILPNQQEYVVLVDGLQRLAIGTMLLNALHAHVLSHTPNNPGDASYFLDLRNHVLQFASIYQHNNREFRNHRRQAIADQYSSLADKVTRWVEEKFNLGEAQQLANDISRTFLAKQIAVDIYTSFPSQMHLMNTFLGLNTIRVDLGPVDLLRSFLVEQGTAAQWRKEDIEQMENEFTDIFTKDEKPNSELLPFVSVILNAIKNPTLQTRVFPTWNSGLTQEEVTNFLDFVREFQDCNDVNSYFSEIRALGSIPYATLIVYYYCQYVHNGQPKPSFLTGEEAEDSELHQFLLANYRVYLDGRIGRTRVYAEQILAGRIQSLEIASNQISNQFIGRNIGDRVDRDWLRAALNKIDKNRSKRVFNAMLLPERTNNEWGQLFSPLEFGRKATQFHVDHLIPESMKNPNQPGEREINGLRNFAPLRSNQNRIAKATNCSSKLSKDGIYGIELQNHDNYHSYCTWLVNEHAPKFRAQLDDQTYLEPNQDPPIGDQRIDFITEHLLVRV